MFAALSINFTRINVYYTRSSSSDAVGAHPAYACSVITAGNGKFSAFPAVDIKNGVDGIVGVSIITLDIYSRTVFILFCGKGVFSRENNINRNTRLNGYRAGIGVCAFNCDSVKFNRLIFRNYYWVFKTDVSNIRHGQKSISRTNNAADRNSAEHDQKREQNGYDSLRVFHNSSSCVLLLYVKQMHIKNKSASE